MSLKIVKKTSNFQIFKILCECIYMFMYTNQVRDNWSVRSPDNLSFAFRTEPSKQLIYIRRPQVQQQVSGYQFGFVNRNSSRKVPLTMYRLIAVRLAFSVHEILSIYETRLSNTLYSYAHTRQHDIAVYYTIIIIVSNIMWYELRKKKKKRWEGDRGGSALARQKINDVYII